MIKMKFNEKNGSYKFRTHCSNNKVALQAIVLMIVAILKEVDKIAASTKLHNVILKWVNECFEQEEERDEVQGL